MYANEIQAVRKLRSAADVAVNSLEALRDSILTVQPNSTKLAGAIDDDIGRAKQLAAEANQLFGERFAPVSHSKVSHWARAALLSLSAPVDDSDIEAARYRLRQIIDLIDARPEAPSDEVVRYLIDSAVEWFPATNYALVVLEHVMTEKVVTEGVFDEQGIQLEARCLTLMHEVRTLEEARPIVERINTDPTVAASAAPGARYNKGLQEFAPDAQPRLPNCPFYMSGWNEAALDYHQEMKQERHPGS